MIAMIRDAVGNGVRCDRIDGWEPRGDRTRVSLAGGDVIFLRIPVAEFVERLDRALTAIAEDQP